MAGPSISSFVSPTGGVIVLNITPSIGVDLRTDSATIQRYTGSLSSTPLTIFSGAPLPLVFIDDGERLPTFLDFAQTYFYTYTDSGGTATTSGIVPASQLKVFSSYLDKLIFRLFSAGISAVAVPQGFNPIRVLEEMPLSMGSAGSKFPFIVMNLDLEQQDAVQIGQNVEFSETNTNIIPVLVFRRYSLSILSHNAKERDFYKDSVIGVLYTMMQALASIGEDVSYSFQAAQSQVADATMAPGFYISEVMLDITGNFNVSIQSNYPIIESITPVISATTVVVSGNPITFTV